MRGTKIQRVAYLAPDMARVFVHERLSGIAEEQLGNDQQADIFLTIKRLLKDMATIAIGGKLYNPPSTHDD